MKPRKSRGGGVRLTMLQCKSCSVETYSMRAAVQFEEVDRMRGDEDFETPSSRFSASSEPDKDQRRLVLEMANLEPKHRVDQWVGRTGRGSAGK